MLLPCDPVSLTCCTAVFSCRIWREQATIAALRLYHTQNVSMPEDMFGAYLRHIKKDLHFKERLRSEYSAVVQTSREVVG